jgi:hypothetical protein
VPLVIGVIVAAMLLAWAGVEAGDLYRHYTLQFWFGVASVMILAVALTAAKWRKEERGRVPLRPAVPPPPPALKAAPVLRAVAAPHKAPDAPGCEGPRCDRKVSEDPWTARVEGCQDDHVFCSQECAREWTDRQTAFR